MESLPKEALQSMYDILGKHPGCRTGHAKGVFCTGTFIPSERARELTKALHLQTETVGATVRFSNVTGDPNSHDGARKPRGMATRFHLRDGFHTDLIGISLSRFTNRTPADFIEMNYSCFKYKDGRTRFRPLGTARFILRHPESLKGMLEARPKPVPSYANCRYNSLNSFIWTNEKGARCCVRYAWMPEEGQLKLGKEAKKLPPDFLQRDLYERLGRTPPRPIRFWLEVQLASIDDEGQGRINDPTRAWPKEPTRMVPALQEDKTRKRARFLTAGVLELTGLMAEPVAGGAPAFSPLNLTEGIAASEDPILRIRPAVYDQAAKDRTSSGEVS